MAVVELSRVTRPVVVSVAARRQSTSKRLTEAEADDLRYLWQSYAADLGIRSVHGALEARLLMSPPREAWRPVIEELQRAGGRSPEGRIVRLVVAEGWGTRHEVRQAVRYLTRASKRYGPRVERIEVERPESTSMCEGKCRHACPACEWTGHDLRLTERGELRMTTALRSVPTTRAERWAAQDAAIEAECHTLAVGGPTTHAPATQRETLVAWRRASVERARASLSHVTAFDARVLYAVFGEYRVNEDAEIDAVKRLTGGDRTKARAARDAACEAYRKARRM